MFTYKHARPSVTADIIVFSIRDGRLHLLLIERGGDPFKGAWALPGGFVKIDEDLLTGAKRELHEETGLPLGALEGYPFAQVGTYGAPDRDPRGRVITVAFLALIPSDQIELIAATDASDAQWFAVDELPDLAFDHAQIIADARAELTRLVTADLPPEARTVFAFLPQAFTLAQVQTVFETLGGTALDKRNFRKWLPQHFTLKDLNRKTSGGQHRPAALFSLD